jgi:hypothetical protein
MKLDSLLAALHQFTVIVSVAGCVVPLDELNTVIVLVPGGVPDETFLVTTEVVPPPHAIRPATNSNATASNRLAGRLRLWRFLAALRARPTIKPPKPSDAKGDAGFSRSRGR